MTAAGSDFSNNLIWKLVVDRRRTMRHISNQPIAVLWAEILNLPIDEKKKKGKKSTVHSDTSRWFIDRPFVYYCNLCEKYSNALVTLISNKSRWNIYICCFVSICSHIGRSQRSYGIGTAQRHQRYHIPKVSHIATHKLYKCLRALFPAVVLALTKLWILVVVCRLLRHVCSRKLC